MAVNLSAAFRDFYGEVLQLRRQIAAGTADADLAAVRQPLKQVIAGLATGARDGTEASNLEPARSLMAAFADQVFSELDWPLAEAWRGNPLAVELFQTPDAGAQVFARIKRLLEAPERDGELARLYLTALDLGFGTAAEAETAAASRARLVETGSSDRAGAGGPIFPDAYARTDGGGAGEPMPGLKGWWLAAIAATLIVVLLSWPIWRSATTPVAELVTRILGA